MPSVNDIFRRTHQDVPYWIRTRLESKDGAYYLIGIHGVSLDDLKDRIREARY